MSPVARAALVTSLCAAAGFWLGYKGVESPGPSPVSGPDPKQEQTPVSQLTRVGYALERAVSDAPPAAWDELARDVRNVRASLGEGDRPLFDLASAVRGLEAAGKPEWARAERVCHEQHFPRCDHKALESLSQLTAPGAGP